MRFFAAEDVDAALTSGAIGMGDIVADLSALSRGAPGRRSRNEITLFKSIGAAIQDLAAAILFWRKSGGAVP